MERLVCHLEGTAWNCSGDVPGGRLIRALPRGFHSQPATALRCSGCLPLTSATCTWGSGGLLGAMAPWNDSGDERRPPRAPRPSLFSRLSQMSKRSFLSHSSSFEADDERSSIGSLAADDDFATIMSRNQSRRSSASFATETGTGTASSAFGVGPPPRYPGDDTRPTSRKELAGWYAYAFAAEVYVICG